MAVDINYWMVGLLFLGIVLLVRWLITHDRKDEKDFEKQIILGEIKTRKHNDSKEDGLTN